VITAEIQVGVPQHRGFLRHHRVCTRSWLLTGRRSGATALARLMRRAQLQAKTPQGIRPCRQGQQQRLRGNGKKPACSRGLSSPRLPIGAGSGDIQRISHQAGGLVPGRSDRSVQVAGSFGWKLDKRIVDRFV